MSHVSIVLILKWNFKHMRWPEPRVFEYYIKNMPPCILIKYIIKIVLENRKSMVSYVTERILMLFSVGIICYWQKYNS